MRGRALERRARKLAGADRRRASSAPGSGRRRRRPGIDCVVYVTQVPGGEVDERAGGRPAMAIKPCGNPSRRRCIVRPRCRRRRTRRCSNATWKSVSNPWIEAPNMICKLRRRSSSCSCWLSRCARADRAGAAADRHHLRRHRSRFPIAVVPFAPAVPADGGLDVADVVQRDLDEQRPLQGAAARADAAQADARRTMWRSRTGTAAATTTSSSDACRRSQDGQLAVDFDLVNALTGQTLATQRFTGSPAALRNAAHRVSDVDLREDPRRARRVCHAHRLRVGRWRSRRRRRYQLIVADADGENPRVVLESAQPIMSPAWSPDGQWLAYVSFEGKTLGRVTCSGCAPGERTQVSARAGINGAPAFSPDGKQAGAHAGGQRRQSGHLRAGSRHAGTDAHHR